MKKSLIIIFITVGLALSTQAQRWQHIYGEPNQTENSWDITEHYDNGYFITGSHNTRYGWLIKTDINGAVLWDKIIGKYPDEAMIRVTVYDDEGNIYVLGTLIREQTEDWPFIVKLNPCGEKLWCKWFIDYKFMWGDFFDAIVMGDGDIVGLAYMPTDNQYEMIYLFRISPDGELRWKKSYASHKHHEHCHEMRLGYRLVSFNNLLIIVGYAYLPYPGNPNHFFQTPMFIGVDYNFEEKFLLPFGMRDSLHGKAFSGMPLNDSIFMGVGAYRFNEGGYETCNTMLMFFNKDGEEIGYSTIPNEAIAPEIKANYSRDIARINDSLFMTTTWYGEEYSGNTYGEFVIDTAGTVYDNKKNYENVRYCRITKTFDNKYIISGNLNYSDIILYKINENLEADTVYPGNYNYDSLCNELPIPSGTIDLADCDIVTNIDEIPTLEEYRASKNRIAVEAFPNPVTGQTVELQFKNPGALENLELRIFNVLGREVHKEKIHNRQTGTEITTAQWQAGIYVAIIYSNGLPKGKCKLVVKDRR